jgi:hypothetical protein
MTESISAEQIISDSSASFSWWDSSSMYFLFTVSSIRFFTFSRYQILIPVTKSKLSYDGRSVLVSGTHLVPVTNFSFSLKFYLDSCGLVILWRPLWREDGSIIYFCCWASQTQFISGLSPAGLKTIFYCPNCWDSPNLEGQVPVFMPPENRVAQL